MDGKFKQISYERLLFLGLGLLLGRSLSIGPFFWLGPRVFWIFPQFISLVPQATLLEFERRAREPKHLLSWCRVGWEVALGICGFVSPFAGGVSYFFCLVGCLSPQTPCV